MYQFSKSSEEKNTRNRQNQVTWECTRRRFPKGDRRLRLFSLPFGRLRRGETPATNCNPPQKIRLRSGFLRSLRRRLIQHIANEVVKERLNIFFIAAGAENARVVRIRSRIQERVQIRQIRTRDAV